MIEILAGCWTNSLVGAEKTGEMRSDFFSSLFIAMQPELLLPRHQFEAKIQILMERIKASKPAGFTAIRLPGRGDNKIEKLRSKREDWSWMPQLLPICEEESENSTRFNCLNYLTIPGWFSIQIRTAVQPLLHRPSRVSRSPTLTNGTRRRPARDPRPSPLSLTVDGS